MARVYNHPSIRSVRRTLRKNMPTPENILWYYLRSRRLAGFKFRRQYSIGRYIVDFYCPQARIGIEIDGDSHYESKASETHDQHRQQYLESYNIRILRFTNRDIMKNIEGVLQNIKNILQS